MYVSEQFINNLQEKGRFVRVAKKLFKKKKPEAPPPPKGIKENLQRKFASMKNNAAEKAKKKKRKNTMHATAGVGVVGMAALGAQDRH